MNHLCDTVISAWTPNKLVRLLEPSGGYQSVSPTRKRERVSRSLFYLAYMITQDRIKEILHYDPLTGIFSRINNLHKKCGSVMPSGYIVIKIYRKNYLAHRLAWLYVYGEFPKMAIDHINGIRCDNKIGNLRLATSSENNRNAGLRKDNTSGAKGVSWKSREKRWVVQIAFDGKTREIGYFKEKQEAIDVHAKASAEYHGEFSKPARRCSGASN